jgi:archaemetzincin
LQPLGAALPDEDVAAVSNAITVFYALTVKVLPRVELPKSAWYPPRRRWRAEKLLDFLDGQKPADGLRILGLTAADISTTKGKVIDWGVLGLGDLDGAAGVISTFRCHKKSRSEAHARERLSKVAVHEIGHTLALPHCPSKGCLMEDAEGSVQKTDTEYDLCGECRRKLAGSGRKIPESPAIPWQRP